MMTQNNYFKQIFSQYSGYVYEFKDEVPNGESPQEYIVNEFITTTGKQHLAVTLTQLPKNGRYILHSNEYVSAEQFQLVADLGYQDPLPEPEVQDESQGEE
jgi:hypothetical protein